MLNRAVQYIRQLKENEARNIEKWTLEKLLMDQAMGDMQAQVEESRRRWEEERGRVVLLEKELTEARTKLASLEQAQAQGNEGTANGRTEGTTTDLYCLCTPFVIPHSLSYHSRSLNESTPFDVIGQVLRLLCISIILFFWLGTSQTVKNEKNTFIARLTVYTLFSVSYVPMYIRISSLLRFNQFNAGRTFEDIMNHHVMYLKTSLFPSR